MAYSPGGVALSATCRTKADVTVGRLRPDHCYLLTTTRSLYLSERNLTNRDAHHVMWCNLRSVWPWCDTNYRAFKKVPADAWVEHYV